MIYKLNRKFYEIKRNKPSLKYTKVGGYVKVRFVYK